MEETGGRRNGAGGWRLPLARLLIGTLGRLPLRVNRALGVALGTIAWHLRTRGRRVTLHNLALCFPGMPADERRCLGRRSSVQTGISATETAWCWHRPIGDWWPDRVRVLGVERYEEALASGRGVLLATPHLGGWEASMPVGAVDGELHYFYRVPRDAALEPVLRDGRANLGGQALRLDAGGIRRALKLLGAGGTVGILPDQEPDRAGGVFAPLFGTPALTMTLLSKLAARSGATVVFLVMERRPGGWCARFVETDEAIGDRNATTAAAALNRSVERCIALAPTQYLWSYRRFRELPQGGRRDYRCRP